MQQQVVMLNPDKLALHYGRLMLQVIQLEEAVARLSEENERMKAQLDDRHNERDAA